MFWCADVLHKEKFASVEQGLIKWTINGVREAICIIQEVTNLATKYINWVLNSHIFMKEYM